MRSRRLLSILTILLLSAGGLANADPDPEKDILVTFNNDGASAIQGGVRPPYRARKRYSITAGARRDANAVASEYALEEVDHWPIRSLGVYCFVYRVPDDINRVDLIAQMRADDRIESVQPLQEFTTGTDAASRYNDTYVDLQHGLGMLNIERAHSLSRGEGVTIAVIDSNADTRHEDLRGRIRSVRDFTPARRSDEREHGTAVVSVIVANANNATGIVGIAPESRIDLLVSCWLADSGSGAVCDSFTLAKALDTLVNDPPRILNMSISGPEDALLGRLLEALVDNGVIVVAADTSGPGQMPGFPANQPGVVSAVNAHLYLNKPDPPTGSVLAPGDQIMVAIPKNAYDFRSGSSLAAAQISGVIALMLENAPATPPARIRDLLRESQDSSESGLVTVNACKAMLLSSGARACPPERSLANSEVNPGAQ